jgi:hypothetical protein
MARSNGDLVAKARQMCEDAGRRPASVQEARDLLGVSALRAQREAGSAGASASGSVSAPSAAPGAPSAPTAA